MAVLSRRARRIRWLTVLSLCLVLVAALACPRAGRFLVVEDAFAHAEVAVVLSGGAVVRALAAADLYKSKRVDRIVVIPDPPEAGRDQLIALGLLDPSLPPIAQRILAASGVPASQILFLSGPVDGTITEAFRIREFFGDQVPRSLVVVTSKFASRRARCIFRRVFARSPAVVLSYPSPYDPFEADRWWSQPRNALTVVMEYQKFVSNALTLAFAISK